MQKLDGREREQRERINKQILTMSNLRLLWFTMMKERERERDSGDDCDDDDA